MANLLENAVPTSWARRFDALWHELRSTRPEALTAVKEEVARRLQEMNVRLPLASVITSQFATDQWMPKFEQILKAGDVNDPAVVQELNEYAESRLGKLRLAAEAMSDPDDETDLRNCLVYWYVEAKSEWFQFNTRINYNLSRKGEFDPVLVYKAGIGSAILADLESIFDDHEIDVLAEYLFQPLPSAYELHAARHRVA